MGSLELQHVFPYRDNSNLHRLTYQRTGLGSVIFYISPMRGSDVLFAVLFESRLYYEQEFYDLLETEPDFEEVLKEAWKWLKN